MKSVIKIIVALHISTLAFAQMSEQDVRTKLDIIFAGNADQVRSELPALEKQYPNDAGTAYLRAVLTTDGAVAMKQYQEIVDTYPHSDWADDALYKVYQYFYSIGLYKTADAKMALLKERYPSSIYVVDTTTKLPAPVIPTIVKKETTVQAPHNNIQPTKDVQQETSPIPRSETGKFAVQIGVYSVEEKAKHQAEKISATVGRQATVNLKQSGEKTFFAITFEGFATEQDARNFMSEIKMKYALDSYFVKR